MGSEMCIRDSQPYLWLEELKPHLAMVVNIVTLLHEHRKNAMSVIPLNFDTLSYVKRLEAVGVPREQAEVQAETMRDIVDEKLATKTDITELKRDIKEIDAKVETVKAQLQADISQLCIDTTRDLRELEMRMLIKLGGMMAASIAVVAALAKLL